MNNKYGGYIVISLITLGYLTDSVSPKSMDKHKIN
jgi:hypothetical protein